MERKKKDRREFGYGSGFGALKLGAMPTMRRVPNLIAFINLCQLADNRRAEASRL